MDSYLNGRKVDVLNPLDLIGVGRRKLEIQVDKENYWNMFKEQIIIPTPPNNGVSNLFRGGEVLPSEVYSDNWYKTRAFYAFGGQSIIERKNDLYPQENYFKFANAGTGETDIACNQFEREVELKPNTRYTWQFNAKKIKGNMLTFFGSSGSVLVDNTKDVTIDGVKYTIGNGLTLDEQAPTRTYIVFNYSFIYPGGAGASDFGNIESFNSASDTVTIQLIADGQNDPSYETTASGGTQNDNKFTAGYSFTNVASGSYTMRVIKKNHVTREYALTVGADSVEKNVKIHLLGDVDGDGNVSTIDWSLVRDHINETNTLTGYEFDCANVDKDEYITSIDCVRIQDHINESVPLW